MQLAFASGRIQNPATTSTTKSLQCFNVLVRVNSAGSSTCSNCHFVQPKLMANHLQKVKRESSKQIKQMDCQASRARTTRVLKHCWSVMGLVVTQNWPERSPCCIVLAAIAKAYLVVTKDFLREAGQRSTQEILMVSGKGLKRQFLTVYLPKKKNKRNVSLWKCLRLYQWRWECTGKNIMKHTAETLKNL